MRTTFIFLLVAISSNAQNFSEKVITSPEGIEMYQSLRVNDSTLANWYINENRSFFGTTNFECTPNESYEFMNMSFNSVYNVKGLVGLQNNFYSLLNYNNGSSSIVETSLISHDNQGTINWQKKLESQGSDFWTSTDMTFLNDSIIATVSHSETQTSSMIHLFHLDGTLQNSFEISGAGLSLIERNNDSTFWVLGSYLDSGNNQISKIALFDVAGNNLKEFGYDNLNIPCAVFHDSLLKVIFGEAQSGSQIYAELDSTGLVGIPKNYPGNFYASSFVDLIPFNQHVVQIQHEEFQVGFLSFYDEGKYLLEDMVETTGFVVLDSVNAFIYSKGPFYGIKSLQSLPEPHIGVTLIDSTLTDFQSCTVHSDFDVPGTMSPMVLDQTNSLVAGTSGTTSISSFSMVPIFAYAVNTCMDMYGAVEENEFAELQLYPNPSEQLITIVQPNSPINRLEICALNGKLIQEISSTEPITSFELDKLSPGVYLLKSWSNSGQIYLNRFVKK